MDLREREAVDALVAWLADRQYPLVSTDGHAQVWDNGRPLALDVLEVVNALRQNERLKVPA